MGFLEWKAMKGGEGMNAEAEQALDELIALYQGFGKHTVLTTQQDWQTLQALKELKRLALLLDNKYQQAKEVS